MSIRCGKKRAHTHKIPLLYPAAISSSTKLILALRDNAVPCSYTWYGVCYVLSASFFTHSFDKNYDTHTNVNNLILGNAKPMSSR